MGSRLGRRVIHFSSLPLKLLLPPPPLESVREFAVKTLPSASKIDIRRTLESIYGFDIAEVRTLNMDGKRLRRGFFLATNPAYKKAYVTLRAPLSVSPRLFPIPNVLAERDRIARAAAGAKAESTVAEGDGGEDKPRHWMDETRESYSVAGRGKIDYGNALKKKKKKKTVGRGGAKKPSEASKFPWTGMRTAAQAVAEPKGHLRRPSSLRPA